MNAYPVLMWALTVLLLQLVTAMTLFVVMLCSYAFTRARAKSWIKELEAMKLKENKP